MAVVADELLLRIRSDVTQAVGGIALVDKSIKKLAVSSAASLNTLGVKLMKTLTVPLLAIGGASAMMASNFEDSFAKMKGLIGASADDWDMLRDSVLALAGPATRRGPQELAEALFFIESAGFRGVSALQILETSGKAAAAGMGETKVVADLLTSALFAFNKTGAEAGATMDIIVAAAREGKAEPSQFAEAMSRLLPIAAAMGIEFEELAAQMALMTKSGDKTQEAATKIRSAMAQVLKPTDAAAGAFENLGMSFDDVLTTIRERGMTALLADIEAKMADLGLTVNEQVATWAELFPNIRALGGVLQQTGGQAGNAARILDAVTNSMGSLDEAFRETATTSEQFHIVGAQLQSIAISLGTSLLPALSGFASGLSELLTPLVGLVSANSDWIVTIAKFAVVAGPAIFVVGKLVAGFHALRAAIWAAGVVGGAGFVGTMRGLVGAINPVTAGVVAAVAVFTIWNTKQKEGRQRAKEWKETLDDFTGSITENTIELARNALSADDDLKAMNALGITVEEFVRRSTAGKESTRELEKQIFDLGMSGDITRDQMNDLVAKVGEFARSADDSASAWEAEADSRRLSGIVATFQSRQLLATRLALEAEQDALEAASGALTVFGGKQSDVVEASPELWETLTTGADNFWKWHDEVKAAATAAAEQVNTNVQKIATIFDGVPDQLASGKDAIQDMLDNAFATSELARQFETDLQTLVAAGLTETANEFREKGPTAADALRFLVENDFANAFVLEETLRDAVPGAVSGISAEMSARSAQLNGALHSLGMSAGAAWAAGFNLKALGRPAIGAVSDPNAGHLFRHAGGPVRKGMPVVVGETKAEVFVPDANGSILPDASKVGGGGRGGGGNVQIFIAGSLVTEKEMVEKTRRALLRRGIDGSAGL